MTTRATHSAQARHAGPQTVDIEVYWLDGEVVQARLVLTYFEVEDAPFFLLRFSEQGRLHQAERELAQSVCCFEAGTLLGTSLDQLVPRAPGRNHEQLRESFNAQPSVRAMGAHRGDLEARRQDGSVFPVEVSLSYFHLDDELYVVSYVLDITFKKNADQALLAERQRVERFNTEFEQKVADRTHALLTTLEQLEQRQAELAQALAAEQELGELKSRFVSMASHEFRTPLTAVLTSASLIEQYSATEQQDKRLRHLGRLAVSQLLE